MSQRQSSFLRNSMIFLLSLLVLFTAGLVSVSRHTAAVSARVATNEVNNEDTLQAASQTSSGTEEDPPWHTLPVATDDEAEVDAAALGGEFPLLSVGSPALNVVYAGGGQAGGQVDEPASASAVNAPVIDVWYGSTQSFGHIGNPAKVVGVLGKITSSNAVSSVVFSLNGGAPQPLSLGPNTRRLGAAGDFNAEISTTLLISGSNQIVITATDVLTNQAVQTVTVNYVAGRTWPASYEADWGTATNIQQLADVVDGKWALQGANLRPVELGYDRLVAIGDVSWKDYEVVVPLVIHGIDEEGFKSPSNGPGVGVLLRWQGHYNEAGEQPNNGWQQLGALGWFRWKRSSGEISSGLQMVGTGGGELTANANKQPEFGVPYLMKMSVQAIASNRSYYRFKVWKASDPEPFGWDMETPGRSSEPPTGSLLLVAHHVDASFGKVTVTPLSAIAPKLAVNVVGGGAVQITPSQPSYSYGQEVTIVAVGETGQKLMGWSGAVSGTANPLKFNITQDTEITATFGSAPAPVVTISASENGSVLVDPNKQGYAFGERLTFTAVPNPGYMLSNWTGDLFGKTNPQEVIINDNLTVGALFVQAQAPYSDDFNQCALNDNLWTFRDPQGDSTFEVTGRRLLISVPAGTDHDLWRDKNFAPRMTQPVTSTNFVVEAKFESEINRRFQMQGIVVEQDDNNLLRFEFYSDGTDVRIFAAILSSSTPTPTVRINQVITPFGTDMYMRVERAGNQWTQSYSFDGTDWTESVSFTHTLTTGTVGVYAGNAGAFPAHTAIVDYFFNTAAPIVPEDSKPYSLTVNTVGSGAVARVPAQESYTCGERITLTATPEDSWSFAGWSGAVTGATNPVSFTFDMGAVVTATFSQEQQFALTIEQTGQGAVAVDPPGPYTPGQVVTLTATPEAGWEFTGWSGDLSGDENPIEYTVTDNATITANFSQTDHQIYLPVIRRNS
ncbi:MAG: hypothetical protein DCC55_08395 [Chloroflexi bacterium]|nr:MAG: hypothetical protein DCC55_08395 [Chloroflexota bacterium]